MNDNPYLVEQLSEQYRQRRMKEAEQTRLLRSLEPVPARLPAWRTMVLSVAHGFIAVGQRLERAAELRPQPACESC
jgi:hypothetical protein